MLNNISFKTFIGLRYVYLTGFFALLSGFFNPLITNTGFQSVILGIIVLFVGLTGSILIYKSINSETRKKTFVGAGFALITISFFYVLQITGRI
jgi:hypothetical protein